MALNRYDLKLLTFIKIQGLGVFLSSPVKTIIDIGKS